ncbi:MAG: hypothetical protein ACLGI5_18140 [Thermoleophilia bacterium]
MKAALAIVVVVALVIVGAALLTEGSGGPPATPQPPGRQTSTLRRVPAPQLTDEQINRQDRPNPRRQREEARAFDARPLLNALPAALQGVTFDIGGLAPDGHTTVVVADAHGLGGRRARIAFETLQRRAGDRSNAYQLEVAP